MTLTLKKPNKSIQPIAATRLRLMSSLAASLRASANGGAQLSLFSSLLAPDKECVL
jgi:hypothetical protein